jgi:hypothetical protein
MRKLLGESWTLAGVLLVIITLSGDVQTKAIFISLIALGFWWLGAWFERNEEDGGDDRG